MHHVVVEKNGGEIVSTASKENNGDDVGDKNSAVCTKA